ncbi:unnamed protein product [Acanthoscelides obtectus]|uniref:Uncharacterized protein n=1 Tax=Acanthoscelides obtectus TaxID=200917 RepID=A0A9P0M6H0_ACAOB|nr:unnamed protein product [Acanthoscelides obtectus]CAK1672225.1 hypothetical protein AOBTE_LOCUS28727 [Acanthoscelides obtectus]
MQQLNYPSNSNCSSHFVYYEVVFFCLPNLSRINGSLTADSDFAFQYGKNNPRSFQPISDENSPWANAELERLVNLVGAEPVEVLDPFNTEELDIDDLIKEMGNGVDLFLDANPVQYMSRVQLRGSQLPSYFPGN